MTASYRSKRFCSDKCRVYFRRENVQFIKQKTGQIDVQKTVHKVTKIEKKVTDVSIQKEISMGELFKLMREGKM